MLGVTENSAVPRRLLVAPIAVTITRAMGPFGTGTIAVAKPEDDAFTVARGVDPTLAQWIATFSPAENPLQVTVTLESTVPEVGENVTVTPPAPGAVPAMISGTVPKPYPFARKPSMIPTSAGPSDDDAPTWSR